MLNLTCVDLLEVADLVVVEAISLVVGVFPDFDVTSAALDLHCKPGAVIQSPGSDLRLCCCWVTRLAVAMCGSLALIVLPGEPSAGEFGDREAVSLLRVSPVRLANDFVGCAKRGDCFVVFFVSADRSYFNALDPDSATTAFGSRVDVMMTESPSSLLSCVSSVADVEPVWT